MILSNLDQICRQRLLKVGLPIHYYLESLVHAADCLRQLSIDTLQIVDTVTLTLNSYFAIDLPDNFVDDVGVYIPVGNLLQQVVKKSSITPLRSVDNSGAFVPYSDSTDDTTISVMGSNFVGWMWNVNDLGESTGRRFGAGGGAFANGYIVDKKRRQIQFTETFTSETVVLMYISDGRQADNATQVDVMAIDAILAYIAWQSSPNRDNVYSPEAMSYFGATNKLRARLNPLTTADIKDVIRKATHASIKG